MDSVVGKATVQIHPDLNAFGEELKAKLDQAMAGTDQSVQADATVTPKVNDTEYRVDIEKDKLDADELGLKHPTVKVSTEGGVESKSQIDKLIVSVDELGKSLLPLAEGGGGVGDNANKGLGQMGDSAAGAGEGIGGILLPAILLLGGAITPLVGVTTGFAIALAGVGTAAAAGLGGFAIAAYPVVKAVGTAMQQITADQQALQRALTPTAKATALQHLQDDIAALPPGIAQVVASVKEVQNAFHDWDSQFQGVVLKVLNDGLKLAIPLLQDITPLVTAGATALDQMFATIGTGLQQSDFKGFIKFLADQAPAALNSIVVGTMNFMGAFSKMIEAFGAYIPVIENGWINLTAAMERFAESQTFRDFVQYVIREAPLVGQVLKDMFGAFGSILVSLAPVGAIVLKVLDEIFKGIVALNKELPNGTMGFALFAGGVVLAAGMMGKAFEGIASGLGHLGHMLDVTIEWLIGTSAAEDETTASTWLLDAAMAALSTVGILAVAAGVFELIHLFGLLPGLMYAGVAAVGALTVAFIVLDAVPPVALIVGIGLAIAGLVAGIIELVKHWSEVWTEVKKVVADVLGWMKTNVPLAFDVFHALGDAVMSVVHAGEYLYDHWRGIWAGIKDAVGDAVSFIRSHVVLIAAAFAPLALAIAAPLAPLLLLGGAVYMLYEHWSTVFAAIKGVVQDFANWVMDVVHPLEHAWDWVAREWDSFLGWFDSYAGEMQQIWNTIVQIVEIAVAVIVEAVRPFVVFTVTLFRIWGEAIKDVVAAVWPLVTGIIRAAVAVITAVVKVALDVVVAAWRIGWGFISAYVRGVFDVVVGIIRGAFILIRGIFETVLDLLTGHWSRAWNDIGNTLNGAATAILRGVRSLFADMLGFLLGAVKDIIRVADQIWQALSDGLLNGLHALWSGIANFFTGLPGQIWAFLKDAVTWLFQAGVNIVEGLINGLKSMAEAPLNAIKDVGKGILHAFSDVLGIFSPSKAMHDLGKNTMQGMTNGLKESSQDTVNTAKGIAQSILDAFGTADKVKTDAQAVGSLKAIFDNLAGVFAAIATAGTAADGITSALQSIGQAVDKLNSVLGKIANLPDPSGDKDKVKTIGDFLGGLGGIFKGVGTEAASSGNVTTGALQGIIDSVGMLVAKLPWIMVGIDLIGNALRDTTKPVQVTQWATTFFTNLGELFTAFSQPGADWTLVSTGAVKGVVDSLAILAQGVDWILLGIKILGQKLHDIAHPVETTQWAITFFDAIGKLFAAFSHPGANWVLVTKDAMNDVINSVGILNAGVDWLLLGVRRLSTSLHAVATPIETLAWADKFFKAINDLFVAFSHPGANWTLVSTGAVQGVVGAMAAMVNGLGQVMLGVKIIGNDLHSVDTPIATIQWLSKLFDALHDLWTHVALAASNAGLAGGGAGVGIAAAINSVATAITGLPAAISAAGTTATTALKALVDSLNGMLKTFQTGWHADWNTLKTDTHDLSVAWGTDWTNMTTDVSKAWTSMSTQFGLIDTKGIHVLGTASSILSISWATDWTNMTTAVQNMANTVNPILKTLGTNMANVLVDAAALATGVTSVANTAATLPGPTMGPNLPGQPVSITSTISPTIRIDGSTLDQAGTQAAIEKALENSYATLADLIAAHTTS